MIIVHYNRYSVHIFRKWKKYRRVSMDHLDIFWVISFGFVCIYFNLNQCYSLVALWMECYQSTVPIHDKILDAVSHNKWFSHV